MPVRPLALAVVLVLGPGCSALSDHEARDRPTPTPIPPAIVPAPAAPVPRTESVAPVTAVRRERRPDDGLPPELEVCLSRHALLPLIAGTHDSQATIRFLEGARVSEPVDPALTDWLERNLAATSPAGERALARDSRDVLDYLVKRRRAEVRCEARAIPVRVRVSVDVARQLVAKAGTGEDARRELAAVDFLFDLEPESEEAIALALPEGERAGLLQDLERRDDPGVRRRRLRALVAPPVDQAVGDPLSAARALTSPASSEPEPRGR